MFEMEMESLEDQLLMKEAAAHGLAEVPDCQGAVQTGPGNGADYPAGFDYDPCENQAVGYFAGYWLCADHAEEAGQL